MRQQVGELATVRQGLVTSGRGAGARTGTWQVRLVSGGDIEDDILNLETAEAVWIEQTSRTQIHLLQPHDVLVTARSTKVKAALVPPGISPTLANSNLLVVRAFEPEMGIFMWWFFTSDYGRRLLEGAMLPSATLMSLPANRLATIDLPMPPASERFRLADLIETSERAYISAIEAARTRRNIIKNDVINDLLSREG
jgi:hypothetical protein